jgi:hypothetical protein
MDAEGVAQMAVVTSAFSFAYARQHDEAGWVASAACGTMPLVAFLAMQGSEEGNYLESSDAAAIWLWFSLVFVVCFCITMVSVKVFSSSTPPRIFEKLNLKAWHEIDARWTDVYLFWCARHARNFPDQSFLRAAEGGA